MSETYTHNNQHQPKGSCSSRLGLRTSGGEIVEVHGGHIVRSTSRKDRHSKVCTAKGPRDRRVRLSAHTAIQFYDVQDRLGYDRPSKAVDWLIKKAKTAIDKLAELPAWKPTLTTTNPNSSSNANLELNSDELNRFEQHPDDNIVGNEMGNEQNSSFLPASLDSDTIADTIKSFFPMGGCCSNPAGNDTSSGMQFHRSQDLKLSLQSFQDPILHHHRPENQEANENSGFCFDGSGWPENNSGGFQRMVAWGGDGVSSGFVFSSSPAPATSTRFLQPLFGQAITSELFNNSSQREPLQSSTAPSFRAWIDPLPPFAGVGIDHAQHPTLSGSFHRPGLGGFSGLGVVARIEGGQEEHDGRQSSASSDSHWRKKSQWQP
ncbi:hypothetical protein QVD17_30083 [Tagetes erecta]|uniref:TCP domain-containing protein n=1 Tax=Tagetes erecta TaxID=13708 RepID=A0AAD8K0W2_TARER|nr:hypothetical protein QVD17_30083 [Tagetes erecta]